MTKLTRFLNNNKALESYTYLKTETNLDFEENTAYLTPYNAANKHAVKKGDAPRLGLREEFAPYSNICGLLAVNAAGLPLLDEFYNVMQTCKETNAPSYD